MRKNLFCFLFVASSMIVCSQEKVMSKKYYEFWNDSVQQSIDKNIELYRKADATVTLNDVKAGSDVKIEQISSDFLFGSNIFLFGQFDTPEKNKRYEDAFGNLFNAATVPFYWKTLEPIKGKPRYTKDSPYEYRRPATDPVVEFCESKGINMNGHAIIYGMRRWGHPDWMPDNRKEMEAYFEAHVRELAERYKGRLQRWDVVNEAINQADRGIMPDDYTYKTYLWAMKYFPDNVQFNMNDCDIHWGPTPRYVELTRNLIDRGIRINNVGVQMHIFTPEEAEEIAQGAEYLTPQKIIATLDMLRNVERPIHISEVTITAPDSTERGSKIQCEMIRDLYRIWFSYPATMGITWWNLVDGGAAPGEPSYSGLFDKNVQPKPAYYVLDNLINKEWRTNISVKTDKNGIIKFRGFKGVYRITWKDKKGHEQNMKYHVK